MLEKVRSFAFAAPFCSVSGAYPRSHVRSHAQVALICPNIGMVYSGMGPDFRVLVAKARKSAQAYWKIYGEYPSTRVMVGEIATVMQDATQSGCVESLAGCLIRCLDARPALGLSSIANAVAFSTQRCPAIRCLAPRRRV